jgi:predicted ATP-dependent serine protease
MRTLARAVGSADIGGEPLPSVFRTLDSNKIIFRRAEVSMIAGTPGAGKSTLALAIALRTKVPTLYVSADTNAHTMAMRLLSMTLADVDQEVLAFEELWGCAPTLIIIDNLMDISNDGGEEFAGMRSTIKELKYLARDTNSAVLVLHHTKESYIGNPCQPRSALQGMVAQLPALICTVGSDAPGYIAIASVKNRYGKADPSGGTAHWLQFNPEIMDVSDIPDRS